jgi:hypothetical protein
MHDQEASAWPPYVLWRASMFRAAAVAQFNTIGVVFGDGVLAARAPKDARCVIDYCETFSAETANTMAMGIGSTGDIVLGGGVAVQRLDGGDDTLSCTTIGTGTPSEIVLAGTDAGSQNVHSGDMLIIQTPNLRQVHPMVKGYPLAILRPGQQLVVQNRTANLSMTVVFAGRYYVGQ